MPAALSLLRVEPESHLVFTRGGGGNGGGEGEAPAAKVPLVQNLKITNTSEGNAAWKVRTTAPQAFLVKPRAGVVKPGESAEVAITLLPDAGTGLGSDLRFEVRAAAVPAERESIERADWQDFPSTAVEVARLRALCREQRGDQQQQRAGAACGGVGDGDAVSPESRRRAGGASDRSERVFGGGSAAAARRAAGGGDERSDEPRGWRPPRRPSREQDQTAASLGAASPSGAAGASSEKRGKATVLVNDGREDGDKLPPMSTATKGLLGVLIAILVFNLYLRPLLGFLLGEGDGAPSSSLADGTAAATGGSAGAATPP